MSGGRNRGDGSGAGASSERARPDAPAGTDPTHHYAFASLALALAGERHVDDLGRVASTDSGPERSAEASEDSQRVRQAVANLPEEHRLVVELRFFAGAKLDEIAAVLDCPLGTVKSRLHHALEKLRQMNFAVNLFPSCGEVRESKP